MFEALVRSCADYFKDADTPLEVFPGLEPLVRLRID